MDNADEQFSTDFKQEMQDAIGLAESAWRGADATRMGQALASCARLLRAFPAELKQGSGAPDPGDRFAVERATLWLWRGRLLVLADQGDALNMGLECLEQAIVRLEQMTVTPETHRMQVLAWMNRGHGYSRLETTEGCMEAVVCYDRAAALLKGGDVNALGAALMNRAVNLIRLDDNAEACRALEQAVAVLTPMAEKQGAARRNLSSAWANLGVVRRRLDDPAGALEAQREAVEWFRPLAGASAPVLELGARILNLAQAAHDADQGEESVRYWREALGLIESSSANPEALELSLRARHGLCVALGALISGRPGSPECPAWTAEAGDMVEAGLGSLSAKPVNDPTLGELGERLYAFGAWLYRTQQPHFLGEYLLEHLDESAGRQGIAREALAAARQAVVQKDFPSAEGLEQSSSLLRDLSKVETGLRPADGTN